MLDPFEMKANPTCVDCMAWSEDGVLAIGAGESVHIFTPKHAGLSSEREPQTRSTIEWASAKVQVNQFSYEEWPVLRSQQLSFFSLGEELSDSHVISLAWSYEGVGLFRRPVLAVLTSNLLLSLWASQDGSTDWQRILIVNHALRDYFSVLPVDDTGILHRRQRVRSFAWSPPCKNGQCAQDRWGAFFLGIYNDEHEVVVLRLYPFERTTNGTSPVAATVLNHFPLQQPSENETSALGSIFERLSNAKAFASHMAWSTWNWSARDGFYTSHLALTNGARPLMLQLRASSMSSVTAPEPAVGREASAVIAKDENTVMGLEQLSLSWVEEAYEFLRGPICWDMVQLLFTLQGRLTVGQGANEGIAVPCPSVDQIIAITPIKDSNSAHMAAHLSGLSVQELASSGDACDTLSDKNRLSCSHNKELQKQIEAVRNRFDLDYDLGGHSMKADARKAMCLSVAASPFYQYKIQQ
ncbi:hypothetical protein KEM55_006833 [Ascosphaera atra]|nr:hypothetical protein KEM55_006833 [Ascosphaera atra]